MNDRGQADPLARGYRLLLACYPAWYRRIHGEELLGVLMTASPPGKRRPGIAEAADLLLGAVRIRCQPSRDGAAGPVWRDALAVLSAILPVIFLLTSATALLQGLLTLPAPGHFSYWMTGVLALAAGALLGLRMRRLAALATAGLLIWLLSGSPNEVVLLAAGGSPLFWAILLQIAALAASPGPRRGLQILTWKHITVVVIATLLFDADAIPAVLPVNPAVRLVMIPVVCSGMALASSLGRWLLLWLAIPGCSLLLLGPTLPGSRIPLAYLPMPRAWVAAIYLPPLALAGLAIVAARRASRRSS
jgi:hypothetical protein